MGTAASRDDESRRDTGLSDASRQANRHVQDRMREINSRIQKFDTKVLKKEIIEWMQVQVNKTTTSSVAALKSKNFNQILLKLLQSLDSTIYGKIVSTLTWTLGNNHLNFNSPGIHKDLMQYYLQQVYDDKRKESSGSDINLFREFVDCWISTESIEILNHIIYFAMELDDPAFFDVTTVYKTKQWPKNDTSDLRQAFADTIQKKSTFVIKYIPGSKFKMESKDSVQKMKKLQFFLNQISDESRTITTFLFELFNYIFNHISLKVLSEHRGDVNEVITRFLFSKNSNLLAILLYLVRVIHSKEHNMFCEKQESLKRHPDRHILRPSNFCKFLRRRTNPDSRYELNFTHDLSSTRRNLKKELVENHLLLPINTYDDLISRLRAMADHLKGFNTKDHFFIYFWVDILDRWIFEVFSDDIDIDFKIEIIHIIIKYLPSAEVVVYLFAVEKLHEDKISKHKLYQLFKNALIHEVKIHEEDEKSAMNFDTAIVEQTNPDNLELQLHRSQTRCTNLQLSSLAIIEELKESQFEDHTPTKLVHEAETYDTSAMPSLLQDAGPRVLEQHASYSPSPYRTDA